MEKSINIRNKRASHEYFLIQEVTAGIQLTGTEIKSIREGTASIVAGYCTYTNGELFVRNMHIAEYSYGTHYNHEPKRDRKLLLTKRELKKLLIKVKERGFTIIPILLFINERGLAKLTIALARGKHSYDKRETLKQKDHQREMERH